MAFGLSKPQTSRLEKGTVRTPTVPWGSGWRFQIDDLEPTSFSRSQFQASLNPLWGPRFGGRTGCCHTSPPNPALTPVLYLGSFCHSVNLRRPSWPATMFTNRRLAILFPHNTNYRRFMPSLPALCRECRLWWRWRRSRARTDGN